MPNYVANRVVLVGSDETIKKVIAFVKSDESVFDFNKIVPMPETFLKYDTTNYPNGKQLQVGQRVSWEKDSPIVTEELIEEYKQATREQEEKYGVVGWYDWSINYWGTKWNACDALMTEGGVFLFDTAWSAPIPVLTALSKLFPDVEIQFTFADEDCSFNTGEGTIQNGDVEAYYPEGNSEEGWQLYFELHPGAEDDFHKDENGQWVYNED